MVLEGGRLGLNSFFRIEQALVGEVLRGACPVHCRCIVVFSRVVESSIHSGSRGQEVAVAPVLNWADAQQGSMWR